MTPPLSGSAIDSGAMPAAPSPLSATAPSSSQSADRRETPWLQRRRDRRWSVLPLILGLAVLTLAPGVRAAGAEQLMRLLERGSCPGCRLQDADLVHADLRDADLRKAQLQRANLSGSRLDGAKLQGADLSFTSLQGASLRGADLRGARLEGTDLRESDLSGAQLDPGTLSHTYWQAARGIQPGGLSYAQLHNAGVEASVAGNPPEAERLFGEAIVLRPDAALTWLARGIARSDQGKRDLAAADFRYAASLYGQQGDALTAKKLTEVAVQLEKPPGKKKQGSGAGFEAMQGLSGALSTLMPLALKFLPMAL